ncbi:EpsG family protein [Limosilactobacillus reuteri]|uniref:EpsG family protein n=1 Tax=Limosilactobacillus reuteri TaxID=1598 RepID=UPI00226E4479|nr:EpsG family protein [Limosilactobacillus reuteri]MCC4502875.1 EpsG family protein [Limosilactobacillus reuteri]
MKLLIIYILLLLLSFTFKKSKIVTVLDFLLMWIMIGWSSNTADYNVYIARYFHPELYDTLEPIYVGLQSLAKVNGYSYSTFLIVMSFIALLLKFISIFILTKNVNEVIGLWMIFPFVVDINQVREFYATSVAFLGLAIFLRVKKGTVGITIAVILCIIGGMIHISVLFYLVLLIPYLTRSKKNKFMNNGIVFSPHKIVLLAIALYILALSGLLYKFGSIFGVAKWSQTATAASMAYSSKTFYYFEILLFFFIANYILNLLRKEVTNFTSEQIRTINWVYSSNYILLLVLAFAVITPDIYRIQQEFIIFIYCVASYFSDDLWYIRKRIVVNNVIIKMMLVIFAVVFCWLMCAAVPTLRDTVFIPAFNNNLIVK